MKARRIGAALVVAFVAAALAAGAASSSPGSRSAKPFIVLVTDVNQLNDHGFNQLAYQGLLRAEHQLGIHGAVYQSPSAAAYIPNLATAARKGAALVISVGFDQANAIAAAAKHDLAGKPKNVEGLIFKEQEVGYLAGYLAGLVEKQSSGGSNTIGSVGGQKQPPVDRYIAGYRAGATAADPGIKLLNSYSQDWVDQAKCKQAALDQISAGANIVFQVAGGCGLGALDAAKQKGVWGIGVDADQSYLGKEVLTSAMKRVDTSVLATIKQVLAGSFAGGTNSVFSLKNNGVALGAISPKVPKADVAKVRQIAKEIATGKIKNIPTTVS